MKDQVGRIALVIFDWLNREPEGDPKGNNIHWLNREPKGTDNGAPYTANPDSEELTITVDGILDCRKLAAAVNVLFEVERERCAVLAEQCRYHSDVIVDMIRSGEE